MNPLTSWNPHAELSAWKALVSTLIAEQVQLREGNIDNLASLAASKRELVVRLAPHIQARGKLLVEHQQPNDVDGMEALIHQARNPQIAAAWREIRDTERMARDLNQLNGRLIHMRLNSVEQALGVLSRSAGGQTLYKPDGQASHALPARAISA